MPNKERASAADLVRNFGFWQEKALQHPVYITHHKRERLVLSSIEHFHANTSAASTITNNTESVLDAPEAYTQLMAEHWALLDNMPDGYVVLSDNLAILAANRYAETLFGAGRNQLVGQRFADLIPANAGTIAKEYVARALRTRETVTLETEADGRAFRIQTSSASSRHCYADPKHDRA